MNSKNFTRAMIACLLMWAVAPGLAFCELKTLNDEDLSMVDAKAGDLLDTRNNEHHIKSEKTAGLLNESANIDSLNHTSTCSSALDCSPAQNNLFSPGNAIGHQAPLRFSAPMPHCGSGSCR
jgi:hypothetical protein